MTIPLLDYREGLLAIDVDVADKTERFLFDTGAGVTTVSPEIAHRLGCTPAGRVTGFRMSAERLDLPTCRDVDLRLGADSFRHEIVSVLDVGKLLPPDWPKVAGVISLATLENRCVTLSLAERTLTVESTSTCAAKKREATAIRSRVARTSGGAAIGLFVAMGTPKHPQWFLLDSGNVGATIVAPHAASFLNVDLARAKHEPKSAERPESWQLSSVSIPMVHEPRAPFAVDILVKDIIYDGALGTAYMGHWRYTIDLRTNGGIWVTPSQPK